MKRLFRRIKERLSQGQRGQALILFVFTFVALLAVVGIAVDAGNIYVQYSHLRRAVDSAVVAAVSQYRENRVAADIYEAVLETAQLQLPGVQNVRFYWCSRPGDRVTDVAGQVYDTHDPRLCSPGLPRKLIRVEAELPVNLVFLSLVWGPRVTIRSAAQAEAAVLNVVLLIDTSESMAWEGRCNPNLFQGGGGGDNALNACMEECRAAGTCKPFDDPEGGASVRRAARAFVNTLMRDGVDRFAVYHFDKAPVITPSVELFPCDEPPGRVVTVPIPQSSGEIVRLTTDKQAVLAAINDINRLNVYVRPRACDAESGLCCESPTHVGGTKGEEGEGYGYRQGSTNLGGGLREAINELLARGSTDAAVWVIVLISDGAANMTDQAADENRWWTCPAPPDLVGTGFPPIPDLRNQCRLNPDCRAPTCRDIDNQNPGFPEPALTTRHCPSLEICRDTRFCDDPPTCTRSWYTNWGETVTETIMWHYDADDYARDMADLASSHKITIYAVGLGTRLGGDGEELLRYIADVGDDGDLRTAPCGSDVYWDDLRERDPPPRQFEQCGNYYYAADAAQLTKALEDIAKRIFSRITE